MLEHDGPENMNQKPGIVDMQLAPVSILAQGIRKTFGSIIALDGVTLDFSSGRMHGVIGPEGAGKTTLMRIILGLLRPVEGTVEFKRDGKRVNFEEIRPHVAYMPQQQSLYPDLSIKNTSIFSKNYMEFRVSSITQDVKNCCISRV